MVNAGSETPVMMSRRSDLNALQYCICISGFERAYESVPEAQLVSRNLLRGYLMDCHRMDVQVNSEPPGHGTT